MTQPTQLHISGPSAEGGSPTGPDLDLYLVEEDNVRAETDTNERSIPGQDDDESVLAGLTGQRDVQYSGIGDGLRLYYDGIGSDPVDAVKTHLIELESLVQSNQGVGYAVTDDMRNQTIGPSGTSPGILFSSIRWEQEGGQPTRIEWDLQGQVSDGVQQATDRQEYITNQNNARDPNITEDMIKTSDISFSLGFVDSRTYERKVDLNTLGLVHQYDVSNVGISQSGVQGSFTVEGFITVNDVSDLAQTSVQINEELHGIGATIEDAFTERPFTGLVSDSSASFAAGDPDRIEYRIELTIGKDVSDLQNN